MKVKRRLATTSIGPSTAHGMGPDGNSKMAHAYMQQLDLSHFKADTETTFLMRLDIEPEGLRTALPCRARHWESARKFLNIFLGGAAYNRFVCEALDLYHLEPWLDLPLGRHVANGLRNEREGETPLALKTVVELKRLVSDAYQQFAAKVARQESTCRVHLDLDYGRRDS